MAVKMAQWVAHLLSFLNGFRKLVICVFVLGLATLFLVTGHLDGAMYTNVLTITVPAYFAGNIGEHLTGTVKSWLENRSS